MGQHCVVSNNFHSHTFVLCVFGDAQPQLSVSLVVPSCPSASAELSSAARLHRPCVFVVLQSFLRADVAACDEEYECSVCMLFHNCGGLVVKNEGGQVVGAPSVRVSAVLE